MPIQKNTKREHERAKNRQTDKLISLASFLTFKYW